MTMFPSPDDLAIIAKHQMDEQLRAAPKRRMVRIAQSRDRAGATAKPMQSGFRFRFGRFGSLRKPFLSLTARRDQEAATPG